MEYEYYEVMKLIRTTSKLNVLKKDIRNSLRNIIITDSFSEFLKNEFKSSQEEITNDVIVLNNSLFYRGTISSSAKNSKYLWLTLKKPTTDIVHPELSQFGILTFNRGTINKEIKVFRESEKQNLVFLDILDIIKKEICGLGELVFFLIGKLYDVPVSIKIDNKVIKQITADPEINNVEVQSLSELNDVVYEIRVNTKMTNSELLQAMNKRLIENNIIISDREFINKLKESLNKLRNQQKYILELPTKNTASKNSTNKTFLRYIIDELENVLLEYEYSLKHFRSASKEEKKESIMNILRISYNFADDFLRFFKVLSVIFDTKPIIFWLLSDKIYILFDSISKLDIDSAHKKKDILEYRDFISKMRNRHFHRLLPFDKIIEIPLENIPLHGKYLQIFPEFSERKKHKVFEYEDRLLFEALEELTRSSEAEIDINFLESNLKIIENFKKLLEALEEVLWFLLAVRAEICF